MHIVAWFPARDELTSERNDIPGCWARLSFLETHTLQTNSLGPDARAIEPIESRFHGFRYTVRFSLRAPGGDLLRLKCSLPCARLNTHIPVSGE